MIPRIKNNYMRPNGVLSDFKIELDPLPTKFDNYFIETCRAAEEIYNLKQGKLHLLYSGGLDSEYALSVFLHLGMDITPVIIKLNPGYNDHDLEYAFKFCESKNIKPLIIDIDFPHFVKSGKFYDIMKITEGSVYTISTTAYALGQINGSVLVAANEPYIGKHPDTGEWYFVLERWAWGLERYCNINSIDGTVSFNAYTPEMVSSWLMDPRMAELANNLHPGKRDSQSSKHYVYNRDSGFNLEIRPKFHGWEKIILDTIYQHEDFEKCHNEIYAKFKGRWSIKYFDLIKNIIDKS